VKSYDENLRQNLQVLLIGEVAQTKPPEYKLIDVVVDEIVVFDELERKSIAAALSVELPRLDVGEPELNEPAQVGCERQVLEVKLEEVVEALAPIHFEKHSVKREKKKLRTNNYKL
jgi:hypothetical protein